MGTREARVRTTNEAWLPGRKMKLGLGALLTVSNPADVTSFTAKTSWVSVNIASSDSQSGSLAAYAK
jgi:hypothetical protein